MQRVSVLLLAASVAIGAAHVTGESLPGSAGHGNATAEVPYGQALGLPCSVDADCGYVPSLACVNGYDNVLA